MSKISLALLAILALCAPAFAQEPLPAQWSKHWSGTPDREVWYGHPATRHPFAYNYNIRYYNGLWNNPYWNAMNLESFRNWNKWYGYDEKNCYGWWCKNNRRWCFRNGIW